VKRIDGFTWEWGGHISTGAGGLTGRATTYRAAKVLHASFVTLRGKGMWGVERRKSVPQPRPLGKRQKNRTGNHSASRDIETQK